MASPPSPFDRQTLAMCAGDVPWDRWSEQRSASVGRLVDLGLIRAEDGAKTRVFLTEAGEVVRSLATENAEMLAALQAVRNFGSRGETDEGISVSYLVEKALARTLGESVRPPTPAECEGAAHEWIARSGQDADELDLRCKRCGALGYTCPECDGWGLIYGDGDDGRDIEAECDVCRGARGIEVATGPAVAAEEARQLADTFTAKAFECRGITDR